MVFIHDTTRTLMMAVDLVNTLPGLAGEDSLTSVGDLDELLDKHPYTGRVGRDEHTVRDVRKLRLRLRELWRVERDAAVPLVNDMLADGSALPRLVRHEGYEWHIHATDDDSPLATRMMVEAAMAFVDVIRADEYARVRTCEADDCDAVYVDYSKNRSKRYCDTGNCGNRMNVNAYRARKARRKK